jgi:Uma2 family endonuclease
VIVGNAYAALRTYVRAHPGWNISVGDPGTKLQGNPPTLRGPDVGVIRAERAPTGKGVAGWLEGAPDLAVEVSGDAQGWSELMKDSSARGGPRDKALEYLGAGARMVWLLDPDARRVVICTRPSSVKVLGPSDALEGGDVLPDFRCAVSELFE